MESIDYEKLAMISMLFHFFLRITCFILGFLTVRLGHGLILQGAKGEFKYSGSLGGLKSKLESFSPGLLFVLLGILLIGYGMSVKREVVIEKSAMGNSSRISLPENSDLLYVKESYDSYFNNDFNNALSEIKKDNYSEAIKLLKAIQGMRSDSKIAFWLSYSYAQIDDRNLCRSYSQLALEFEPELNDVYKERINQLIDWVESSSDVSVNGRFPANVGPPYFEIEKSDLIK